MDLMKNKETCDNLQKKIYPIYVGFWYHKRRTSGQKQGFSSDMEGLAKHNPPKIRVETKTPKICKGFG